MFSALYFAYSSFDWRNVLKNGILPIEVFFDYVLLIGYLMNNARSETAYQRFYPRYHRPDGRFVVVLLFVFLCIARCLAWGVSIFASPLSSSYHLKDLKLIG